MSLVALFRKYTVDFDMALRMVGERHTRGEEEQIRTERSPRQDGRRAGYTRRGGADPLSGGADVSGPVQISLDSSRVIYVVDQQGYHDDELPTSTSFGLVTSSLRGLLF